MFSPASRTAAATARIAMIELDDRQVAPGAADHRLADRHAVVLPHRALRLVQLVLEISTFGSSIAASKRPLASCGVDTGLQARDMSEPARGLAVLCCRPVPDPPGNRTTIGTVACRRT
jgi:hypothetical protein